MNKTLEYTQTLSNFDSAYNASPYQITNSIYKPLSTSFAMLSNRSSSPLFRRSISPPPRRPLSTGPAPKFNFDLYKMDEYDDYFSPSYRSLSPSSPRIIEHYPIHSPLGFSSSKSDVTSRLKQINDELCKTLAQSEVTNRSQAPHYHIHHYPLSQHSRRKHRSRSTSEERTSSTELEVSPKVHKARITYKVHIPRHYLKSSRHMPSSNVYPNDEPIVVDLYSTRDQGFVKEIRKHPDNQSPWIVNGTSIRRNSYSDTSTSHTPREFLYGDKPIKSSRRSIENSSRQSTRERIWDPSTKITSERLPKYFEPALKPKYDKSVRRQLIDATESEPTSQRDKLSDRTRIRLNDPKFKKRVENAESKVKTAWQPTITGLTDSSVKEIQPPVPLPVKKPTTHTPPKSKVKSAPSEPTTPTKKVVRSSPPPRTNTERSSMNDIPRKPIFESTPRNENDESGSFFENDTHTSEPSKKRDVPHSPSPIERRPPAQQPRKPSTESQKPTVPEPDKGTKSTVKNGVLIQGNDTKNVRQQNPTPSPTSEVNDDNNEASSAHDAHPTPPKMPANARKIPPPQSNNNNNQSTNNNDRDDAEDENDQEVARSFDINKWLNDASNAILGPSKKDNTVTPPAQPPPKPVPPKSNPKSPPRRRQEPPSPSPDENLYKPPFGPKRNNQKPSSPSPAPASATGETTEVDDFFS